MILLVGMSVNSTASPVHTGPSVKVKGPATRSKTQAIVVSLPHQGAPSAHPFYGSRKTASYGYGRKLLVKRLDGTSVRESCPSERMTAVRFDHADGGL